MTRQLFDDFIGTPPPSTVDVEWIMADQDRARRRRRWLAGAGAAAGVATVLALAAVMPMPPGGDNAQATMTSTPGPTYLPYQRDFDAWLDRELPATVQGLHWYPGEPDGRRTDGPVYQRGPYTYQRPFTYGTWAGTVYVETRLPEGLCDARGPQVACAVVDPFVGGVECAVYNVVSIVCLPQGRDVEVTLTTSARPTSAPAPFDMGLLVPMLARLALIVPEMPE
ncbi:MAG TPA: hypothetical protein VL738_31840 [Dactylosporangium sp.]|jgi:hypothetical protein|nr:hypothetical protein [Dactylosporangium sp.]